VRGFRAGPARVRRRSEEGPGRDRCYDFAKIFAKKIRRKNWRFLLKTKLNYSKF
jgi:hypothetical protein